MPRSAASDLDLHCLFRPVCPYTYKNTIHFTIIMLLYCTWCLYQPHSYTDIMMSTTLFGSRQAQKCFRACAKCADSDHPAHAQSITRTFALHIFYSSHLVADNEGPDQTRGDAQADLGLRCPHMPEGTLSHGAAHLMAQND